MVRKSLIADTRRARPGPSHQRRGHLDRVVGRVERICRTERVPLDKMRNRRRNYELPFAYAIRALADQPGVPVSTGGLETVIATGRGPR